MRQTIALLLLACALSCHQTPSPGFTLQGTVRGLDSGTAKLSVYNDSDRSTKVIDSGTLTNGTFVFHGQAPLATMMDVTLEPGNWSFPVFVENGSITIAGDTAGAWYYDYTKYQGSKGAQVKHYTVKGSPSYDDWQAYENDPNLKVYDPAMAKLDTAIMTAKNVDTEYVFRDRLDSVEKLKGNLQEAWIKRYVGFHPSSGVGLYLFDEYYLFHGDMPLQEMEGVLGLFSDSVRSAPGYTYLAFLAARRKALEPGNLAPDFTLLKKDSSQFTLSSTRGRYIMIDFWASWCHPCRQAIPHWKEVYSKYHAKGFDIVSVTDDNHWPAWFKAMDQEKMPWTQVADEFPYKNRPARVGELYMSHYIPFYVLLDKDGKIILYNPTEKEMDTKLAELFGNSAKKATL